MAVIAGIDGHISKESTTKISCVRTWGITTAASLQEAVCSAAAGAKFRVDGIIDWSGQYSAYGAVPDIWPGESFQFDGAIVGADAAAVGVTGDAICDSVVINIDIEARAILNHQVNFSAEGSDLDFANGSVDVPADDGIPAPVTASACKVEIAPGLAFTSFAEIAEVRTATITISKENLAYASSSTGGVTFRKEGNLDARLDITAYAALADGWDSWPKPNVIYAIKVYVNATEFYLFKYLVTQDMGGLDVDIEGGGLVGGSLGFDFTGYAEETGPTWTQGVITKPDLSDLWP